MKLKFTVEGLDCPVCASKLATKMAEIEGVDNVKINFLSEKLTVETELSETELLPLLRKAAKAFDCDEKVWDSRKAAYRCNCSKHYLSRVLVSLGEEALREIIREDGAARIHCHYCNTDYEFTDADADKIFARKNNG